MERLKQYRWPGNIRELENVLERAVILSNGPTLEIEPDVFAAATAQRAAVADSPEPLLHETDDEAATGGSEAPRSETLESRERSHILATLKKTGCASRNSQKLAKGRRIPAHQGSVTVHVKRKGCFWLIRTAATRIKTSSAAGCETGTRTALEWQPRSGPL